MVFSVTVLFGGAIANTEPNSVNRTKYILRDVYTDIVFFVIITIFTFGTVFVSLATFYYTTKFIGILLLYKPEILEKATYP